MMRRRIRILLGLAIALAVIGGGYLFANERPLLVPVVMPEKDVAVRVYGLGTVEARIVSKIGFEVGAALTELAADSGDIVRKGRILARLDSAEQEAKVLRAKADLEAAEAGVGKSEAVIVRTKAVLAQREAANARQQELVGRSAISAQAAEEAQRDMAIAAADLAVAQSELDVAKARVADARAALVFETVQLEHHVLKAPFDAVVVERHSEAGTVVHAGDTIFTLMDPRTVWTLAYIDEERAGSLAIGQTAEIRLRSLPHEVFSGSVSRIGIESDRVNEERRVWITCDVCPPEAFLGEQAEVWITVAELPNALLVPETAIEGFNGHQGLVWAVRGGKLSQVPLLFGHRTEDARAEVESGLPDGAEIVSAPVKGLTEGRLARATGGSAQ
ncbi:efflux RND transporter periplasmic adaptor subunit [Oricola nitratireducens]|uniref:efflux RND transporter periplasmic adaptor subunit n=1 Tax=Oricola nitratireducens TaxID=2775868 RepID=UPI001FEFABCC|nr:efflux RND transporter periplasmic adaptor subunit [Oricola nitratireducens]